VDALVAACEGGPRDVVLTGGEPLLFRALATLSRRLAAAGHFITVETAGTVWLDELHCDLMSISPKLSHSSPHERAPEWVERHEARRFAPEVISRLMNAYPNWQLKFVVRWRELPQLARDLDEIDEMLAHLAITDRRGVMLMPECTDREELAVAYERLMPHCIESGFRLGERLHIHMFGHRPGT
jgi:7-carboxy-7-deazaguanine synthase